MHDFLIYCTTIRTNVACVLDIAFGGVGDGCAHNKLLYNFIFFKIVCTSFSRSLRFSPGQGVGALATLERGGGAQLTPPADVVAGTETYKRKRVEFISFVLERELYLL